MAEKMDLNKPIMGAPSWIWIGGGVIVLGALLLRLKGGSSSTTSTSGTLPTTQTASGSTPASLIPQFVNQTYVNGSPPISAPTPAQHVYSPSGQDLGEYQYGGSELTYLKNNIGNYGITQSEYQDVVNAYSKIAQSKGSAYADSLHYSWIGPGNVQGIPQTALTANPNQGINITP